MSVGQRIKARRLELKLTLYQLGRLTGLSKGYLSQIENDIHKPTESRLQQIADALSVEPNYFETGTPEPVEKKTIEAVQEKNAYEDMRLAFQVGKRIRICRTAKGMSQSELGYQVERSSSFISKIETGLDRAGTNTIQAIANALGVSVEYLVTGVSEKMPNQEAQEQPGIHIPDYMASFAEETSLTFGQVTVMLRVCEQVANYRIRTSQAPLDREQRRKLFAALLPYIS